MRLLIDIPEKVVTAIQNGEDYRYDIHTAIAQGRPYEERPQGDLISREALKKLEPHYSEDGYRVFYEYEIDNAPTVEVPENEVNCVLTMFGKCSYNETGCSDCEIKDKIRKALNERPQGEWKLRGMIYYCSNCGKDYEQGGNNFCGQCGAKMEGGAE